ncbi:MAG: GerW family sporulation protein [Clostridia bacterium]|nr:GerW family sporulation protein [Clostridia bacterium]
MEKNVHSLLGVSIDKIKEMVDVNTVVGDPIALPDGMTLIPVSRVAYGFASGGSDLPNKADRDIFGGGSGAGVNVTPVAFLVIKNGDVHMMPVNAQPGSIDRAISMVPEMVDKVTGLFKKDKTTVATAEPVEAVDEIVIES